MLINEKQTGTLRCNPIPHFPGTSPTEPSGLNSACVLYSPLHQCVPCTFFSPAPACFGFFLTCLCPNSRQARGHVQGMECFKKATQGPSQRATLVPEGKSRGGRAGCLSYRRERCLQHSRKRGPGAAALRGGLSSDLQSRAPGLPRRSLPSLLLPTGWTACQSAR